MSNQNPNQNFTSFPPLRLGPIHKISPSEAQSHIASFLSSSEKTPYLLPNAKLLASGPSDQGASNGGLVLHNLRRVEAGLRGEVLAPSLEIDGFGGEEMDGVEFNGKGKGKNKEVNVDDMWAEAQDIDSYQREQSVEAGEIGSRQAGESVVDQTPTVQDTTTGTSVSKIDKAARKAAKAARKKAEKKMRK